jgi:glycosyltransferase involved in cell wall biosynthesis
MRVGLYLNYQNPALGGANTFESTVFQALVESTPANDDTFVLCNYDKEKPPSFPDVPHFEWASLYLSPQQRLKAKMGRQYKALSQSLRLSKTRARTPNGYEEAIENFTRSNKIDLLWFFSSYGFTMEIPYIVTVWDLEHRFSPYFPEVSHGGEWSIREKHYETFLRRAVYVVVGTQAGKAQVEAFYQVPPERIKVIPFPTPNLTSEVSDASQKNILEKYNIPENYLFYPARFWGHKNHANLLIAVKLLKDKYNQKFPVVFVGSDSGNLSYIKRLVNELNLQDQVFLLGYVPRHDLKELYENAFALTFVSFFGPDNLPPLEAFSVGCPVIASDVSGAPEQLGEAALLVDPKNPEQIASAVITLQQDKIYRDQLVQIGQNRAASWTEKEYIHKIFSTLDEFRAIRRCWE